MTREERAITNLKQMCSDGRYLGSGSYVPLEVLEDFNLAIKALEQEPFINKPCVSSGVCEHDKNKVLDEIKAEILDCLKALDEIEKFNIYLPNETTARRLTYQQCLEFIDKYKAESVTENGTQQ